jgi:hypothetical protein
MDLLNADNLVELHEKLSEFAKHHENKGGQAAHRLIKLKLVDEVKSQIRDGSKEGMLIEEGYDNAIKQVLKLLHKTFVP